MRHKHLHGSVAFNNGLVLEDGRVSIAYPTEEEGGNPALRLHDGVTPGGWEAVAEKPDAPFLGPQDIIAGDESKGFYGELTVDGLVDGEALASQIGLAAGTPQDTNVNWLKFSYNSNVLFISKRPLRGSITWNEIDQTGAIFGTDVTINGYVFTVRALSGGNSKFSSTGPGGEWNALLYSIHQDDPNSQGWGLTYTDADLGLDGLGKATWTSSREDGESEYWVQRGWGGITGYRTANQAGRLEQYGWRPVLELVGPAA